MTDTIEGLKELLADGYWVHKRSSFVMADPNSTSPLVLELIKGENKVEMTFKGKDAAQADLICQIEKP
jgi:hypothetical protein